MMREPIQFRFGFALTGAGSQRTPVQKASAPHVPGSIRVLRSPVAKAAGVKAKTFADFHSASASAAPAPAARAVRAPASPLARVVAAAAPAPATPVAKALAVPPSGGIGLVLSSDAGRGLIEAQDAYDQQAAALSASLDRGGDGGSPLVRDALRARAAADAAARRRGGW